MIRIFTSIFVMTLSLSSFSQNDCRQFYRDNYFPRPPSESQKDQPGFILTSKNLRQEGYLFEWYLSQIADKQLHQALDEYKGYGHRRMNELLRSENPDFTQITKAQLEELMQKNRDAHKKNPNFDPKAEAFHRLRLLSVASIIEREVFPLGHYLAQGIVLYRAVALKEDQIPKEGTIYRDHAFMSTSVKYASQNFSGDAVGWKNFDNFLQVEFRITNRNYKGKVLAGKFSENEIILQRNTPLNIISVERRGRSVIINADLVE